MSTETPTIAQHAGVAVIERWFAQRGWQPFAFQREVWQAYLAGESGLIHAATGTGKTYAAWLGALAESLADDQRPPTNAELAATSSNLKPQTSKLPLRVLWITPLRALAADTEEALRAPLADLALPWTLETRTGDTSAATRARQQKHLPTALITTPESLTLLLTRADAAELFRDLRLVVVDEWHELLATKRGVQTELALARLRRWRPTLRTWGLSATLGNLDVALAALVGFKGQGSGVRGQESEGRSQEAEVRRQGGELRTQNSERKTQNSKLKTRLVQGALPKALRIESIIPSEIERFPWAGHLGLRLLPEVLAAIEASTSALVFTNTRAQTELWYQALLDARPAWAGAIALHHSSLDRAAREWVEQALRAGKLRCVVCTSSLDLGVDFAPVDIVLQVGSPKGVARLVQRAGRSGHRPGVESRVVCVPTHAFELIEVAAARAAVARGVIEARAPIERPLDVLVQHAVTIALGGGFRSDELFDEVLTTYAYRDLRADEWAWVLEFITRGGPALQSYPEYARVVAHAGRFTVADQTVARRHRMSIGTITSDALLNVQYLRGARLGAVEESFAARLRAGDQFTFAGRTLEFVRVREMTVWVRRAADAVASVPRWSGGRLPLSHELASGVRAKLDDAYNGVFADAEMLALRPLLALQASRSRIPAHDELLIERVKTRAGYHLFCYPFEGRLVHEGLAALVAYRLSRLTPVSFTIAANDYGFELLAPTPLAMSNWGLEADPSAKQSLISHLYALFSADHLLDDIAASLNATEMAKRQFRTIARVAGLIFQGYPGSQKTVRQVQASSGLLYDVFAQYDPHNRLLEQAQREVLDRQLERARLEQALERIAAGRITLVDVKKPTPLAFPLLVQRLRETVSSETLADRVRRMQVAFAKP